MKRVISLIAFLLALGIVLALSAYGNHRYASASTYQEIRK